MLAGLAGAPCVLTNRTVLLCDPDIPATKQPYHAQMGKLEQNAATIRKRVRIIQRAAKKSVSRLLQELRGEGHTIRRAGIVAGSLIEPASIGNLHIRAHAFEGRLFRVALLDALHVHQLRTFVLLERNAHAEASALLRQPEGKLKETLSEIGRSQKPWSANEKLAALAAWMLLAKAR